MTHANKNARKQKRTQTKTRTIKNARKQKRTHTRSRERRKQSQNEKFDVKEKRIKYLFLLSFPQEKEKDQISFSSQERIVGNVSRPKSGDLQRRLHL